MGDLETCLIGSGTKKIVFFFTAITSKTIMLTTKIINCRELPDEIVGGEEGERLHPQQMCNPTLGNSQNYLGTSW